jgi:hypothetical protein
VHTASGGGGVVVEPCALPSAVAEAEPEAEAEPDTEPDAEFANCTLLYCAGGGAGGVEYCGVTY